MLNGYNVDLSERIVNNRLPRLQLPMGIWTLNANRCIYKILGTRDQFTFFSVQHFHILPISLGSLS